jgi:hypothetical protein
MTGVMTKMVNLLGINLKSTFSQKNSSYSTFSFLKKSKGNPFNYLDWLVWIVLIINFELAFSVEYITAFTVAGLAAATLNNLGKMWDRQKRIEEKLDLLNKD